MIIEVKKKHIRQAGKYYNASTCPVARAIKDKIKCEAYVTDDLIIINGCEFVTPPRSVSRFVTKIDCDEEAKPFNFKLNYEPAKN